MAARRMVLAAAAMAALGAGGIALSAAASGGRTVTALEGKPTEFALRPVPATVAGGRVTFRVPNKGKITHELVVIRTNTAPGRLPTDAKGLASEKGAVGETGDIAAGTTKSVTLALKPGRYALICNLPGHYKGGMYAGLRVR
jgi:uncharacterized cupredoxin-like copper-binding protein